MGIFAYKCTNCLHAEDWVAKPDDLVIECPRCGEEKFARKKELYVCNFKFKGPGFYKTDKRK